MKNKAIRNGIIGLGICVILGYGIYAYKAPKAEPLDLKTMMTNLNSKRKEAIEEPIHIQIEELQQALQPNDFTEEEIEELLTPGDTKLVTKEEAIEDVRVLFRALSQSYGGYIYFGGKERFDQAEQEIISIIENLPRGEITTSVLEGIFGKYLDFIVDSHFSINGKRLSLEEQYSCYGNGIDQIEKDAKGYYILEQGEKYYIEEAFETYIKPTIGEEGQLIYGLFTVVDEEEWKALPKSLSLNGGKESIQKQISWEVCKVGPSSLEEGSNSYSYKEVSQIPVISYTDMMANEQTEAFIKDGTKLRNQEVAVLDLRGNRGGVHWTSYMWLYQITGEIIHPKQVEIQYRTQIGSYVEKLYTQATEEILSYNENGSSPDFNKELIKYTVEEEKWRTTNYNQGAHWTEK